MNQQVEVSLNTSTAIQSKYSKPFYASVVSKPIYINFIINTLSKNIIAN